MAVATAILFAAQAMSAQMGENARAEQDAAAYGMRVAGIDYTTARKQKLMAATAGDIEDNATIAEQQVLGAQLVAEADATVSANTAGVSGSSVDLTISESEKHAAQARGALETIKTQQMLQLEQDLIDTALSAELQKGTSQTNQADPIAGALGMAGGFMKGIDLSF